MHHHDSPLSCETITISNMYAELVEQWNPSCEAYTVESEMWLFKRDDLSSGVKINTFMVRFILLTGLSRGVCLLSG